MFDKFDIRSFLMWMGISYIVMDLVKKWRSS